MTQIDKLAGMFYEINKQEIRLEVVERYVDRPNQHISKTIHTDNPNFWGFVFGALIELKQFHQDVIDNDDGDSTPASINRSKVTIEKIRELEKALVPFASTNTDRGKEDL